MTIQDLQALDTPTITVKQASAVLGMEPLTLRWQARDNPEKLGFPVIVAKSRTYIPRLPFIQYLTGTEERRT